MIFGFTWRGNFDDPVYNALYEYAGKDGDILCLALEGALLESRSKGEKFVPIVTIKTHIDTLLGRKIKA